MSGADAVAWLERSYDQVQTDGGDWWTGAHAREPGLYQVTPDHPASCHCEITGGFDSDIAARWKGDGDV